MCNCIALVFIELNIYLQNRENILNSIFFVNITGHRFKIKLYLMIFDQQVSILRQMFTLCAFYARCFFQEIQPLITYTHINGHIF